jgi:hypothetical protein
VLLKAVEAENGDRSGVHLIRRSRKEFDEYVLSFLHGSEIKHFEIVHEDEKYGIKNGPKFENMTQLLDFYKTPQVKKNSNTKYYVIRFNNNFKNLFFSRTIFIRNINMQSTVCCRQDFQSCLRNIVQFPKTVSA